MTFGEVAWRRSILLLAAMACGFPLACGGDATPDAMNPDAMNPDAMNPDAMTLGDMQALGRERCRLYASCCTDISSDELSACQSSSAALFTNLETLARREVEEGRVRFEPEELENCVARHENMTCEEALDTSLFSEAVRECILSPRYLEPLVELGGTCVASWACKDGWCHGATTAERRCDVAKPLDSECAEDEECESKKCGLATGRCEQSEVQLCN